MEIEKRRITAAAMQGGKKWPVGISDDAVTLHLKATGISPIAFETRTITAFF